MGCRLGLLMAVPGWCFGGGCLTQLLVVDVRFGASFDFCLCEFVYLFV